MGKTGKIVLGVVAGLAVLAAVGSIGGKGPKDGAANGAADVPATPVTAIALWRAFDANEVAAQGKYGNGPVQVTGMIAAVELDLFNNPVVRLKTPNQFQPVSVSFTKDDAKAVSALSTGDMFTATCAKLSEVAGAPQLEECTIP